MEEDDNGEDQGSDTSMGEIENASQESSLDITKDEVKHVKTCTLSYQRGSRQVFATSKRQGTLPFTSIQPPDKGKKKVEEEEEYNEKEREFELIHIKSDDENETRISNSLLQDRNAQIKDLEAELERSKDVIHFYQMQNKRMSAQ